MIEPQSLINIVHSGLNKLTDSDKQCIKYEIKESDSTISLYIYKTIPSTNQLNILRLSDHLPSMQKLIRGNTAPRPSVIENSNVSIDFYKPKRIIQVDTAGNAKVKKVPNRFDNYVGVPSNIPQVEPFTVSSFQYFYKDLDQSDEMILWHSIATWVCCLDPNKEYHDPFASDETKMAKTETKTAEVHVFGDKIEITENKQYYNMNKKLIRLTESDLHKIVKESVNKILMEARKPNDRIIGRHKFRGEYYDKNGNPIYTHPSKLDDPEGGTLSDDFLKNYGWRYSKSRGLHGQISDPMRFPK